MRRRGLIAAIAGLATVLVAVPAWAFWTTTASTTVSAGATSLASVTGASATAVSASEIDVAWTSPSGQPTGTAYQVVRDTTTTVCATATSSCNDTTVSSGGHSYSITPVLPGTNWQGSTVSASTTAPALSLSLSPSTFSTVPKNLSGTVTGLETGATMTFRIDDAASGAILTSSPATVPSNGSVTNVTVPSGIPTGGHTIYVTDGTNTTSTTVTYTPGGDTTAPVLQALEMFDVNANGKVDRVVATFNENLASYTAGTAPWTLTNVPSGGTLSSVSVSGSAATLNISEGSGAADTAVGSFTVALAQNAAGIRDAAGNKSSFSATAPTDKAAPVPTSLSTTDGDATLATGDTFVVVFSEPVTGLPTNTTVTEDRAPSASVVTLSIPGVNAGAASLGSNDYLAKSGTKSLVFNATVAVSGSTVTVTATDLQSSSSDPANGSGTAFAYTPAAGITDAAGNAAGGTKALGTTAF